ncbi:hypothetical protein HYFRA_00001940 [Hymenoscyphus fraxineus]|uniref:Choline monooxygenase, chloroplastic n=1 Tax=Hymenoscyphus fraxineus TaxID=746836 RepID=A0A9N9PNW7_9HELO|nr:hypothetical protein HYFRA_00001940 [Hymenoscyphus fraxineus]
MNTPSFEEFFSGLDELTSKVDFTKLPHRRSISYEGNFNWKTMYLRFIHIGTDEEFEEYFKFVRQVAIEDFELCEKAQKNLEAGVYGEGVLNPNKENGVSFYQARVKEAVYRQFEEDKMERSKKNIEKDGAKTCEKDSMTGVTGDGNMKSCAV